MSAEKYVIPVGGRPGCGKDFFSGIIKKCINDLGVPAEIISVSSLLKGERCSLLDGVMKSGDMVNDATVNRVVLAAMKSIWDGNSDTVLILNGWPRTPGQLAKYKEIKDDIFHHSLSIIIQKSEVVCRKLINQRSLKNGQEARTDDSSDSIDQRFKVFNSETDLTLFGLTQSGWSFETESDELMDEVDELFKILQKFLRTKRMISSHPNAFRVPQ